MGEEEQIYLDENELAFSDEAKDAPFFRIGFLKHSSNCKLVGLGLDFQGNERYSARFLDLDSNQFLSDRIEGVYEDFEFGNDSGHVYYTLLDDCERAYQVKRHVIGSNVEFDQVLYHELDEMFFVTLSKSCNGKYIFVKLSAQVTSETYYISADDPKDTPHLLFPRRENIQYSCEHQYPFIFGFLLISNSDGYFYILSNENAKNNYLFRIALPQIKEFSIENSEQFLLENQEIVIEHRDFVVIEDFHVRKNHLIVIERSNCLQNIRIVDLREDGFTNYHYVRFSENVYSLWPGSVHEEEANLINSVQYDTNIFCFTYTSFVQPKQVIDYDMDKGTMTVIHEEKVGGSIHYDQTLYSSRRLYATGVDGTTIPGFYFYILKLIRTVSLVFRRDLLGMNMNPPQVNPLLLHSYGAYGSFINPIFSTSRLSLLDRGFVYAAAHIRGGADMVYIILHYFK